MGSVAQRVWPSGGVADTAAGIYPFLLCSGTAVHVPRRDSAEILSFDICAVAHHMWEVRIALLPHYRFESPAITAEIVRSHVENGYGAEMLGITAFNQRR